MPDNICTECALYNQCMSQIGEYPYKTECKSFTPKGVTKPAEPEEE